MIQQKESGFFTTSLITYVGSLLNVPLTVSGFMRGIDKYSPNSTDDMESIRKYHVTVVPSTVCSWIESELRLQSDHRCVFLHVLFGLEPNELGDSRLSVCTVRLQPPIVVHRVHLNARKVRSDITTYSYAELASLKTSRSESCSRITNSCAFPPRTSFPSTPKTRREPSWWRSSFPKSSTKQKRNSSD